MSFSVDVSFQDLPPHISEEEIFEKLTCKEKVFMCNTHAQYRGLCKTDKFLKECKTAEWKTQAELSSTQETLKKVEEQIANNFPESEMAYITKVACSTTFVAGSSYYITNADVFIDYTANSNQKSVKTAFFECYARSLAWKESDTIPTSLLKILQANLSDPQFDEVFDFEGGERTPQRIFEDLKKEAEVRQIDLTVTYIKR